MKPKPVETQRRKFLAGIVAAGSAAAVVAMAPEGNSAEHTPAADKPSPGPASRGYQRTAHVDAYYRSLRV
jgi:hypothetical protein